jgi:CubicO group peptidase (beta-lactamase class C family)
MTSAAPRPTLMRTTMRLAFLVLVLPLALPAQRARVDSLFGAYDRAPGPGLAVAVVKDGRMVLSEGYGLADIEHGVPITGATVFDIASVSKQFAGLAVAMLATQGRISLDADISTYIPEMKGIGAPITVRNLVHHTSGLRDWPATLALAGWRMDDVISMDQILRFAYAQRSLNFAPGSEYTYSNTGYNLLAEVVARVTGKSFRAWTAEHLFTPLGMTRSRFQDDHTELVPDRAYGYEFVAFGKYRVATDNLTALGSSSLFSSAEDLAKWMINLDSARVGGREAMAMTRNRGVLTSGTPITYAFGLGHGVHRDLPTLAHSGSWAQFATFLLYFPEQRLGVVILANSGSINPSRAAYDVADAYLNAARATAAADTSMRTRAEVTVPTAMLDEYAGVYRLGRGWYLHLRRDGSILRTRATNEDEFAMSARSQRDFWIEAYSAGLTFQRDSAGTLTGLLYRNIRAPRIDPSAVKAVPSAAELAAIAGTYESAELGTTYRVTVENGVASISHFRHGTAPLTWTWQEFTTPWWFAKSVVFERDASGRVTGMVVDINERSRANRFTRR